MRKMEGGAGGGMMRRQAERLLSRAGVEIGGSRPWDIQTRNKKFYAKLLAKGSLGLGEAYMDEWWEAPQLDEFSRKVNAAQLGRRVRSWRENLDILKAKAINLQKPARAAEVGKRHYDIGNDLYERMLDRRMIYSCGYWKEAQTLDEAQEAKLELVCRKLHIRPEMRVLDIGCGWGGAARYMAEKYGAEVTGITISEEQARMGRERCRGLPAEIRMQDYRDVEGRFDRVLSIGMFEHVGYKNYRTFMEVARRRLKEGGLFLLQTIGKNTSEERADPWISRYIFPNSILPSARRIAEAAEGLLVLEDWHNFGPDYDKTLMAWWRNFDATWPELQEKYGRRFYRMWKYYLLCCAGAFRARQLHLWQIVLSPRGFPGGYQAVR